MEVFLLDKFIEGLDTFDYSIDVTQLDTSGKFFMENMRLERDDNCFNVATVDVEGRVTHVATLEKSDDRKKYKHLTKAFNVYRTELSKKKVAHNIPTLQRLFAGDTYIDSTYFDFRPDASTEMVQFYKSARYITLHFVDKKTHALFLLEKPKYMSWVRENDITRDNSSRYF